MTLNNQIFHTAMIDLSLISPVITLAKDLYGQNLKKALYGRFSPMRSGSRDSMKNAYQDALILFFIKFPEPGDVKTRLAENIGLEESAELYRMFVLDLLEKLKSTQVAFNICFYPEQKKDLLMGWLGEEYQYRPQRGTDLGERMGAAFADAFTGGHRRVILIGSDFPDLPQSFLKESLDALRAYDAVIGPALDGGYYLIGFRNEAFFTGIFAGMDWGTEVVFRKTLSLLKDHKQRVYVLPVWNDVDTVEDLKQLILRSEGTEFSNSRTMIFLSKLKRP